MIRSILIALALVIIIPAAALAQGIIAGVVRDTSGAVLPGVTVEAASPALIEKVRSVVTDGTGQYRIIDLRPGVYVVTFTLPGFNAVKREGIKLAGSFTATVNADLRVGALEETITVTGETPTVDVQSATQQKVMNREIIDAIPAGRTPYHLGVLIPGVTVGGIATNVAGGTGTATQTTLLIHGSRNTEQLIMQNGVPNTDNSGYLNPMGANPATVQEYVFDTAAASVDSNGGGVRINVIPRDGGNVFNGTIFTGFTSGGLQTNNIDDALVSRGVRTPDSIKNNWDVNPAFGGPISRDRLWFYASARVNVVDNYVAGAFYDRNANNPNAWTYDPDLNRPASNDNNNKDGYLRLAWQATSKDKVGLIWHEQVNCYCMSSVSTTRSIEAADYKKYAVQRSVQLDWTSLVTSRLLLEAGSMYSLGVTDFNPWPELQLSSAPISVTEQSTGLVYRSGPGYRANRFVANNSRAVASYVTGSHSLRLGFNNTTMWYHAKDSALNAISYRFNNGVPNQLTQLAYGAGNAPAEGRMLIGPFNGGIYVQDRWTISRLTATYGLRYDVYQNRFPEQTVLPALYAPTRNLTIPAQDNVNYKDLSPRLGAAYDLFGTGKTALKVSLNKYAQTHSSTSHPLTFLSNPVNTIVKSTTRAWTDANRNFVPDCDLINKGVNGECGAMANQNFGTAVPGARYDPELKEGFGKRQFNWEFGMSVQREVLPRTSVDFGYYRRSYGNFIVTDNLTVGPGDYTPFTITAPVDSRLPGGGGYAISGLYNLNPNKFGVPDQAFVTRASNYGKQVEHWNGFDFTLTSRASAALMLQGGVTTGRTMSDNCEVLAKLGPEVLFGSTTLVTTNAAAVQQPASHCHLVSEWLTQFKTLASYTIPRVDVLLSATLQNAPGPQLHANYNAPNALVAPSLGRPLSGAAANTTVNLVAPGTLYGDRTNQVDLRVAKRLQFGRTRTMANIDFFNALNANPVLVENFNFGAWRQPSVILPGRVVKFSFQIDY